MGLFKIVIGEEACGETIKFSCLDGVVNFSDKSRVVALFFFDDLQRRVWDSLNRRDNSVKGVICVRSPIGIDGSGVGQKILQVNVWLTIHMDWRAASALMKSITVLFAVMVWRCVNWV
jgi:hypothetical protein